MLTSFFYWRDILRHVWINWVWWVCYELYVKGDNVTCGDLLWSSIVLGASFVYMASSGTRVLDQRPWFGRRGSSACSAVGVSLVETECDPSLRKCFSWPDPQERMSFPQIRTGYPCIPQGPVGGLWDGGEGGQLTEGRRKQQEKKPIKTS